MANANDNDEWVVIGFDEKEMRRQLDEALQQAQQARDELKAFQEVRLTQTHQLLVAVCSNFWFLPWQRAAAAELRAADAENKIGILTKVIECRYLFDRSFSPQSSRLDRL